MRRLYYDYKMIIKYSEPAGECHFTMKCTPVSDARQRLVEHSTSLSPDVMLCSGQDGFGNIQTYGSVGYPHSEFLYCTEGTVEVEDIEYEAEADLKMVPVFRHPYGLNKPGQSLRWYFDSINLDGVEDDLQKVYLLMQHLHLDFRYVKGTTNVKTDAETAWKQGSGVCQDYAHILIALCHMAGIPARYVVGMIVGEGETHAWCEILYKNRWVGVDPTNNTLVSDSHIKLGHGRDAGDCMVNRGIMKGGGMQLQIVSVQVKGGIQ